MSFATTTDWQFYAGENTMSYGSQMAILAWQNFIAAAVGLTVAMGGLGLNTFSCANISSGRRARSRRGTAPHLAPDLVEHPNGSSGRRVPFAGLPCYHSSRTNEVVFVILLEISVVVLSVVTFVLFDAYARACDRI